MRDSELEERFNNIALEIRNKERPKDGKIKDAIILYSYYKQAKYGDCSLSNEPWKFQLENYAKWEAWYSLRGMSKERAMISYINKAQRFL